MQDQALLDVPWDSSVGETADCPTHLFQRLFIRTGFCCCPLHIRPLTREVSRTSLGHGRVNARVLTGCASSLAVSSPELSSECCAGRGPEAQLPRGESGREPEAEAPRGLADLSRLRRSPAPLRDAPCVSITLCEGKAPQ